MTEIKKLVLDVLKPHQPDILDFACAIAELGEDYRVHIDVTEVDDKTQTTVMVIQGEALDFQRIEASIVNLGGSLHSVDQVEVWGTTVAAE